MDYKMI